MLRPLLKGVHALFERAIEIPAVTSELIDILEVQMPAKIKSSISLADTAKARTVGSKASRHKDRDTAIQKYSEAINLNIEALSQRRDDEQKRAVNMLEAVVSLKPARRLF